MAVTVINIFLSDYVRRVRQATALLVLAPVLLYAAVLPICFGSGVPADSMFRLICAAGAVTSLLPVLQSLYLPAAVRCFPP